MKIFKVILCAACLFGTSVYAQSNAELSQLIAKAINNNKEFLSYGLQLEASKANIGSAFDFEKTNVYYNYDENNIAPNDKALRVFGIEQRFSFPTVYGAQRKVYKSQWEQDWLLFDIKQDKLRLNVSTVYEDIVYTQNKELLYIQLDSLYAAFAHAGKRKFELGESNYLEKITAEAKSKQINATLIQLKKQKQSLYERLKGLVQSEGDCFVETNQLSLIQLPETWSGRPNQDNYLHAVSQTYAAQVKLQNQSWLPDLSIELFSGTNKNLGFRQNGFQIGIAIPLFFSGNIAKRKTIKLQQQSWEAMRASREIEMESFYQQKLSELDGHKEMIKYYSETGETLSNEIIRTAQTSYKDGEIDFYQYIQSLESAISMKIDHLDNVLAYNKSYLELYYFNFNPQL